MFDNRLDASPSLSPPAFSDSDEMLTLLHQILLRSSNQCTDFQASQNPNSVLQRLPEVQICEMDECGCPSEEELEALVEEATKQRCSCKRSRAAEVHNMSEKRRRSRINEKTKAFRDLIPNSNNIDADVEEWTDVTSCTPKPTQLSTRSMSNASPPTHMLESSSPTVFLKLHFIPFYPL